MISQLSDSDVPEILRFIGDEYYRCLYLMMDLKRYGTEEKFVDLYVQRNGNNTVAVLYRYYTCLHVFSPNLDLNVSELSVFIEKKNYSMIYAEANIIKLLEPELVKDGYISEYGWLAQMSSSKKMVTSGKVVPASHQDFPQIVNLLFSDEDIGKSYRLADLSEQMENRNRSGFSRNLVIRNDDQVVAHASTNAEDSKIAVVGELIVHPNFRHSGYGSDIWKTLCQDLLEEGREVYSFYYSNASRQLHRKTGFSELCGWGKLVRPSAINEEENER